MALLTSPTQFLFRGSTRRGSRCFLMEQEGQWPKSDYCTLLAWRWKWPRSFCLLTALQQTSVHPAAVAGGAVPDALRRLDLSRSRDALARAPRVARRIEIARGTRLHHLVSFSAPTGRRHRGARAGRNGATAAPTPATSRFCGH